MLLATTLNVSRAAALTAVLDCWAWLDVHAADGMVKGVTLEVLDTLVEIGTAGFGQAMLQAGLVGTIDGALVLPAELRQRQHVGERVAPAAAADEHGSHQRRREQNAASARRYRKKNRLTKPSPKQSGQNTWRTLGRVAGHEVRAYDGQYGCYAMVLGATVGGQQFRKLTAGDKAWSLASVTLTDALPVLVAKWRDVHTKEKGRQAPLPLVPSYVDFRDDAERLTALAKLQADAARHADGADASSRHADASAASAGPSAQPDADGERKSCDDKGLDASSASADRHADALSSKFCPFKSSSSNEEEDMSGEGRKAAGDDGPDQGDAEPAGMAEWDQERWRKRALAEKFSVHLGEDVETILHRWRWNHHLLRSQLELAGIDPNTGTAVNAEAPGVPAVARAATITTTEPHKDAKPAAGSVVGSDGPEFDCTAQELRQALQQQGIVTPVVQPPPDDCRELRDTCHNA
jgi:hypothetical protein